MSELVQRAVQRLRDNIARREANEDVEALKTLLLELTRQDEEITLLKADRPAGTVSVERLMCEAIVATQDGSSGRMVCDVEKLLAYFNAHRSSAPQSIQEKAK